MAKPDAFNALKLRLGLVPSGAPTVVSLHLSSGSVFLQGHCEVNWIV